MVKKAREMNVMVRKAGNACVIIQISESVTVIWSNFNELHYNSFL